MKTCAALVESNDLNFCVGLRIRIHVFTLNLFFTINVEFVLWNLLSVEALTLTFDFPPFSTEYNKMFEEEKEMIYFMNFTIKFKTRI